MGEMMVGDGRKPAVAVIAGTSYDSQLGAELLRAKGLSAVPHAIASSPDEQDSLQYDRPDALAAAFHRHLRELRDQGTELAMLFCNSLSSVVDHDHTAVPVLSPAAIYHDLAAHARSSLVVTGNANALIGVERTVRRTDPAHRVLGISDSGLVRDLEVGDPEAAFQASQLPATLPLAEHLGLDAVVIACTHFTAVLPFVTAVCDLPVIDIGTSLVELTALAVTGELPNEVAA